MNDFVTMAKPVGSLCNMNCSYCYYLKADSSQDPSVYRMKDTVLETYIRTYLEHCDQSTVSFTWHGGEPTLAGLDFFEKAREYEFMESFMKDEEDEDEDDDDLDLDDDLDNDDLDLDDDDLDDDDF